MGKLIDWKNSTKRKPLVIMGARQVGKTWLMQEFGKQYYKKCHYSRWSKRNRIAGILQVCKSSDSQNSLDYKKNKGVCFWRMFYPYIVR